MRGFLTAALLTVLILPARADIVDGGSLTIGGQGVIGGTLTVQGQDSSGFSIKASSSIQAQCVTLQGGQICGPASGNAALSSTNSWTAPQTFASSVTIGPAVYSTTANYTSLVVGGCSTVLYASFTAAGTLYMTGISSAAYKHLLTFNAKKTTTGNIQLTVNNDTGSNYWNANAGVNTSGTVVKKNGVLGYFDMVACYTDTPEDNTKMTSNLTILNAPKLHNNVIFSGYGRYNAALGDSDHDVGCYGLSGHFIGSSPMTSLKITNSAGTMTGWLTLEACVPSPAP